MSLVALSLSDLRPSSDALEDLIFAVSSRKSWAEKEPGAGANNFHLNRVAHSIRIPIHGLIITGIFFNWFRDL